MKCPLLGDLKKLLPLMAKLDIDMKNKDLRADREIVLAAVKSNGEALEFASKKFREDREIVLDAVKSNGSALRYASEELRADKEIVLEAIKSDGSALRYASEELRADREIVLIAVRQEDAYALRFVSEELRANKEIVLEAVKVNGSMLEFASKELIADKEVVLEAVKSEGYCMFENVNKELRADRDIVLEAIKQDSDLLEFASEEFKNDKEVVLEFIKFIGNNTYALEYASEELKADREVVLAAVKNCGYSLKYASEELRANREIVLEAVKNDGGALQYAKKMEPIKIDVSRYHWQIPSPGNVLSGYLEGRPSDEEIRQLEEEALKRRAEWKPSEKALALVEQLKVFIGRRIKIQFWNSMMMYDEDEAPTPLEADCEDVVILNVDMRGDVFPQAYLVIDNIKDREARSSYLTRRERIVDPLANDIVGDFASITGICEVWTVE